MLGYTHQIGAVREACPGIRDEGRVLFYSILDLTHNKFLLQHMENGTIVRLTDRGFGFISREGEEKDLFFHSNELQGVEFNELREGDKVTFEVTEGPKGLNATNVSRV